MIGLAVYGLFAFVMAQVMIAQNGSSTSWLTGVRACVRAAGLSRTVTYGTSSLALPLPPPAKVWYGVFTVSQVLSPLLPIALVAGQVAASQRLSALGVFCLNPKRIAISGKIRVFCFDKTGTLTKDGLDFIGAVGREDKDGEIQAHVELYSQSLLRGLATCHALSKFGSTLVGNEVEIKMFKASKYTLDEGKDNPRVLSPSKQGIHILRRFEFDHARMTMSVVVYDESTLKYYA